MADCSHVSMARAPTERDSIHNDECTKCFINPKSPGGISICLQCFNGGCDSHSREHFGVTGHCVVMRLIKTEKEKPKEEAPEPEITKLAVGGEGGIPIERESDKYDIATSIICLACDAAGKEIPKNDALEAICVAVQQATSASNQTQAYSLEQEYKPCAHTKGLKQLDDAPNLSNRSLQHCNNCELSDSLWLCFTCGFLGCARSNFDGSGGNNHGVEHNRQTGHPLVVKVGTITAEGTADLFCYACDAAVIDEHLKDHLAHFKIDIASQEKTVKSTAELELEFNLEYDWAVSLEKGKKQELLWGPGYTGLQNLGNSCYMASVVQSLFSFPKFQSRYFDEGQKHLAECRTARPSDCYQCQLAKLGHGLLSGEYSKEPEEKNEYESKQNNADSSDETSKKSKNPVVTRLEEKLATLERELSSHVNTENHVEAAKLQPQINKVRSEIQTYVLRSLADAPSVSHEQKGIPPRMFKALISKNHMEFKGTQQQDALEFFQYLLTEIEKNERVNGIDPTSIFKFKMQDRLQCKECNGVAYSSSKHANIALPIPYDEEQVKREEEALKQKLNEKKDLKASKSSEPEDECKADPVNMGKCFDIWASDEEVTKQCTNCKKETKFSKNGRFETFPETLVIHMKRFVFFDWVPRKLRTKVIVGDSLNLDKYHGKGLQDGEQKFPEEAGPVPNAAFVEQLMGMGFGKNRCEHAVLAVDNAGVEPAMNWLFGNVDNAQYDLPVQAAAKGAGDSNVDEAAIQQLAMMGFPNDRARFALQETNNDVARATDWLFSHMDEPLPDQSASAAADTEMEDSRPPNYELVAFITHMGKSTGHGHYVAHILKNGKWAYFNDQKVSASKEPPSEGAYLYFYRKIG